MTQAQAAELVIRLTEFPRNAEGQIVVPKEQFGGILREAAISNTRVDQSGIKAAYAGHSRSGMNTPVNSTVMIDEALLRQIAENEQAVAENKNVVER